LSTLSVPRCSPEGCPRACAQHPGAHILAKAMHEAESTLPELMAPELEAWAEASEQNAKRQPGVS
jgi:hypothetical protein